MAYATKFNFEDFRKSRKREDLINLSNVKNINISKGLVNLRYEQELRILQSELVNLQQWISKYNKRVAVIFEGRDAAGKGGLSNALQNILTLGLCE